MSMHTHLCALHVSVTVSVVKYSVCVCVCVRFIVTALVADSLSGDKHPSGSLAERTRSCRRASL